MTDLKKYIETNNTLIDLDKIDIHNDFETEIGDIKQPDFKSQIKIKRWDNEANFSIRYVDIDDSTPVIEKTDEKIKVKKPKTECHLYKKSDIEAGTEFGGYEFEVILKEKPISNIIQFTIETKGLNFYYQKPLTQTEIDEGSSQPENVTGSYAVYHQTKSNDYSKCGGKNYATGKAFHIYRPEIIDSNNKKIYADLNIDIDSKLLTVTIPQSFLDTALYPVLVDPTFGYTTIGSSTASRPDSAWYAALYTTSEAGTANSLSYYIRSVASPTGIKAALFSYAGIRLTTLQTTTDSYTSTAWHWEEVSITDQSLTGSTEYGLGLRVDSQTYMARDDVTAPDGRYCATSSPSYADFPGAYIDRSNGTGRRYSIYCTYSTGGASGPANLKTYNTNLKANIKSINGNLIANVKSLNTNT